MPSWRVVQTGAGAERPLLVCYFIGMQMDAALRACVASNTTILNLTTTPGDGAYVTASALNPPLHVLKSTWGAKLGCAFDRVLMLGWSRGCEALRTQLLEAGKVNPTGNPFPDAMIALDGIHSSMSTPAWQIEVWRKWFVEGCGAELGPAGLGKPENYTDQIMVATFSQILPPTFRSVRATLEDVTGWAMPPGEAAPAGSPMWPGVPVLYQSGNVQCWSWPGAGQAAHVFQQNAIGPSFVHDVATKLGFPGETPATDVPALTTYKVSRPRSPLLRLAVGIIPAAACGLYLWSELA